MLLVLLLLSMEIYQRSLVNVPHPEVAQGPFPCLADAKVRTFPAPAKLLRLFFRKNTIFLRANDINQGKTQGTPFIYIYAREGKWGDLSKTRGAG